MSIYTAFSPVTHPLHLDGHIFRRALCKTHNHESFLFAYFFIHTYTFIFYFFIFLPMAQRNYPENHQWGSENGGRGGHVGVASEKVVLAFAATLATTGVASPVSAQGVETIDTDPITTETIWHTTRTLIVRLTGWPNQLPDGESVIMTMQYTSTDSEWNQQEKIVEVEWTTSGTSVSFTSDDLPTDTTYSVTGLRKSDGTPVYIDETTLFLPEEKASVIMENLTTSDIRGTLTIQTAWWNDTPTVAYIIGSDGSRKPLKIDGGGGRYTFSNVEINPHGQETARVSDFSPWDSTLVIDRIVWEDWDWKDWITGRITAPVHVHTDWDFEKSMNRVEQIPQGAEDFLFQIGAFAIQKNTQVFVRDADGDHPLQYSTSNGSMTVFWLNAFSANLGKFQIIIGVPWSPDYLVKEVMVTAPSWTPIVPGILVENINPVTGVSEGFDADTSSFTVTPPTWGIPSEVKIGGVGVDFKVTRLPGGKLEITLSWSYSGWWVNAEVLYTSVNDLTMPWVSWTYSFYIPQASFSLPEIKYSINPENGNVEIYGIEPLTFEGDVPKSEIIYYVNGRSYGPHDVLNKWDILSVNTFTVMRKGDDNGDIKTILVSKSDLTQKAPEAPEETLPETLDITQVIMPDGTVTLTVSNVKNPWSTIFTFEIEWGGGKIVNNTGIAPQLPQGTKVNITAEKWGKKVSTVVTTDKEVLPAPSALTMAAVTDTIRDFTWSPVEGATWYIVEVNGTPVATPGGNSARITLPEWENIVVTVRAVKKVGGGEIISSSVSLEGITVRVTIPAPTGCYVSTNGDGSITATCKTTLYYGKEVTWYEFYIDGKLVKTSEKPSETFPQGAGGKVTVCAVLQDPSRTGTQDNFISTHTFAGEVAAYVPPVIPPPAPTVTDLPQNIVVGDGAGTIPENIWSFTVLDAGNKTITATATLNVPFSGTTQPIVTLTRQWNVFTATLSEFNIFVTGTATITIYADGVPIGTYTIDVIDVG